MRDHSGRISFTGFCHFCLVISSVIHIDETKFRPEHETSAVTNACWSIIKTHEEQIDDAIFKGDEHSNSAV